MPTADARTTNRGAQDRARVPLPLRLALRARRAASLLALALLASLALLPPEPAGAQTSITLISNTGQTNGQTGGATLDHAQAFTTGSSSAGYKLTSVKINFFTLGSYNNWEVGIWSDSSGSPNSKIATLTDPTATGAGVKTFTASGNGVDLTASTTYHIVIDVTGAASFQVQNTASSSEDTGGASGWSIANDSHYRSLTSNTSVWNSFTESREIAVVGYAKTTDPTLRSSAITHNSATLTLTNNSATWYYKSTVSGATCSSAQAGTVTMVNLTSLSANTAYTYKAYSDSTCTTANEIASVTFTTAPAAPTITVAFFGQYNNANGWRSPTSSTTLNFVGGAALHASIGGSNIGACATGTTREVGWYRSDAPTTRLGTHTTSGLGQHTLRYVPTRAGEYLALAYCKRGTTYSAAANLMGTNGKATLSAILAVGNFSETAAAGELVTGNTIVANAFRTGERDINLASVTLDIANSGSGQLDVSIHEGRRSGRRGSASAWPLAQIGGNLTGTIGASGGRTTYTASGPIRLKKYGMYYLRVAARSGASRTVGTTNSNGDTSAHEWSIANLTRKSTNGGTSWSRMDSKLRFSLSATAAATLYSSEVDQTSGLLRIANHSSAWWYKRTAPTAGTCTARMASQKKTASLTLTASTSYTYKAYSAAGCADADEIASESFTTPASGVPTLTATGITQTAATLKLAGHSANWWYKRTYPTAETTCTARTSAQTTASLSGLTGGTEYTWVAYDSLADCGNADLHPRDAVAFATFRTVDGATGAGGAGGAVGQADPTVTLSAAPNPVREGSAVTVTATLSAPAAQQLVFPVTVSAGTTVGTLASITIAAGASIGTGEITTASDDGNTVNDTFTVGLDTSRLPSGVTAGATTSVTVTITDSSAPQEQQGDEQTPQTAPGPVTNIAVTHNGTSLTVSWGAPTGATHYDVTYSGNGVNARAAWNQEGTSLTIECDVRTGHEGQNCVSGSVDYTVSVRARNAAGAGAWRNSAQASLAVPGPVTNIRVTHQGTSLAVSWDAPSGATHYDVTYSGNGVNARAAWNSEDTSLTITCDSRTEYKDQHCVDSGSSYTVGIRARNAAGAGAWRNSTSAAPPSLAVADATVAEASEGVPASLDFVVTLSGASSGTVTVDYATSDGTATAGSDYTAASGKLTFTAGQTSKTVSVTVLDDAHDEGSETLTFTLSNASGAPVSDATATGTITNTDPLQKQWLSRFGRTVAGQMMAALEGRFATGAGAPSHLTIAGQRLDLDFAAAPLPAAREPWRDRRGAGEAHGADVETRGIDLRELLLGSSFHFTAGQMSGPGAMTGWGKALTGSSSSSPGGGLTFTSETVTGVLGMDWERDNLLLGLALAESVETGGAAFAPTGAAYDLEGSLSLVTPYARLKAGERLSFWSMIGSGQGHLGLAIDGASQRTDLTLQMVAAGGRADLLRPGEGSGFALALKTDAFLVRTESAGVSTPGAGNLAGAVGEASRVRAVLEGSRSFALAGGGSVEPSLTLGLRHDGGDAETGSGVEVGAGLAWSDPVRGLTSDLRLYGLAAHEDAGYDEWGVSGSLRLAPDASGRGLVLAMTPSWGVQGQAGRMWSAQPSALAGERVGGGQPGARLDAELGYGHMLPGGLTGLPYVGFGLGEDRDVRLGWRLGSAGWQSFSLGVEAARRETAHDHAPEHRIGLETRVSW